MPVNLTKKFLTDQTDFETSILLEAVVVVVVVVVVVSHTTSVTIWPLQWQSKL